MINYDIVIIGSGMGGLICGDILTKEGYHVAIIEKNKQIGGCLQTYVRDKIIFDSGVHYLGGLEKGQNLFQIFKYLGIIDKLKLERLDVNAFDKILFENDDNEYPLAQGYDNFIFQLLKYFPTEEKALKLYCDTIKEICSKFPLYNLKSGGNFVEQNEILEIGTRDFIESITNDKKLQAVLIGNNTLYALQADKTPFYVHAMILNSYIESSWKIVDGGSAIAKFMAKNITQGGGTIIRNKAVKKIIVEEKKVAKVELNDGSIIHGKIFISNIHPATTMRITDTNHFKKAFKTRIESLENSIGCFLINIVLKKNSYKYPKNNFYYNNEYDIWDLENYTDQSWPLSYAIFFGASSKTNEYAESMTILAYMKYDEVKSWANTFNTVSMEESRGEEYEEFKKSKAEKLLDVVEIKFPNLRNFNEKYYTATPLSYRDYIGNDDGSMYGITKDYKNPLKSFISPKTSLENLYFTGQNLNLHGVLGTAMSGLVTCISILENDSIINKIKNA